MNRRRRSRPSPSTSSQQRALEVIPGGRPATPQPVQKARREAEDLSQRAYVAVSGHRGQIDYQPHQRQFFDTVNKVQAKTHVGNSIAVRPNTSLAEQRGYAREDLFAIAEIGHNYLFNGGLDLALSLFEGLVAVAPNEAYFVLALGLTHDRLGAPTEAYRWYAHAAKLDKNDPRPDVNMAELDIAAGRFDRAKKLLMRAMQKSRGAGEREVEAKARAMLKHLERRTKNRRAVVVSKNIRRS